MGILGRSEWDVVIVGAGAAGTTAAQGLSSIAPRPSILLLSEEDRLPYKRAKISKNIVPGFEREQIARQPAGSYRDRGIFVVRTAAQVEALRSVLLSSRRAVVVGAGVLAVEVAEQIRLLGREAVLLGRGGRLMSRHLNPAAAERLSGLLRANGVDLRLGGEVPSLERRPGGAASPSG